MTAAERLALASTRPAADAKPIGTTGGLVVDTPEGIERLRMITCLTGLGLESKGIRVHRGLSCLAVARRDYGIVARNAATAHARLSALMVARGISAGGAR